MASFYQVIAGLEWGAKLRGDGNDGPIDPRVRYVRGSNTGPIVRAIAEAPTAAEAMELCDAAAGALARM
jgi:phosphomannomutase